MTYDITSLSNQLNEIGLSSIKNKITDTAKKHISQLPFVNEYTDNQLQNMFNMYCNMEIKLICNVTNKLEEKRKLRMYIRSVKK